MSSDAQPVVLVLADISGYTPFMVAHHKTLRHSQMIITELLETLMKQVDVPLQMSRVEGDALFLYAIKPDDPEAWKNRSVDLLERLLGMFQIFAERLVEIGAFSVCRCDACANVGHLELKIIVHSGEALFGDIGEYPTLSGVDVIVVHRLAKNSVEEDQYVLLTESAYEDLGVPEGVTVREGEETYDTGTVNTFTFVPDVNVDLDPDSIRATFSESNVAVKILRDEIQREYTEVADDPDRGYHFNTGRSALEMNDYDPRWLEGIPEDVIVSFSGMGNPFSLGELKTGEYVVDIGSGAGLDPMIAARMVGGDGHVIGVDMTDAMLEKARAGAAELGLEQLEFRSGYSEALPIADGWADVIISNGVVNLSPDKAKVFSEMFRVLRPGGRLQIADITVEKAIPEGAKRNIDLWTN